MGVTSVSQRKMQCGLCTIMGMGQLKWDEVGRDKNILLNFIPTVTKLHFCWFTITHYYSLSVLFSQAFKACEKMNTVNERNQNK